MFKVIFNTASSLALKTYNALKDAIANVVIIAFALWLAWYVLKQVSALELKKPSKMIQEILVKAFKVLLVVVILKIGYGQILKLTLDPVFNTGMNYVQTVTGAGTCPSSASYMQGLNGYETEMTTSGKGALPISMGQNILCSIKSMQDAVWRIIAFGRECRCVGWRDKAYIKWLIPNLAYVITGDLLMIGGLLLLLAFPWCLIDCILNMAIAAALLPAAIGAWPFKKFVGDYLSKLWDFFLNAMFNFVFLSIILYIIITVVNQFLQVVDQYATEYDKLINPIHGLAFWSVNGLRLLMVCLLGWVFLDKGKEIAKEFASAPALNIGKKTGGLFAQAAKRAAVGRKDKDGKHHGGLLGIARGGKKMADTFIFDPAKASIRGSIAKKRNNHIMNNKNAKEIRDENGKLLGYELNKNILGIKKTERVMLGEKGPVYSKERETVSTHLKNFVHGKISDKHLSAINRAHALFDGNLAEGETSQISADGKTISIFNKKGKLLRTQTTLEDGTVEIRNAKGQLSATKKTDPDGNIVISTRKWKSVYDSQGNLLSADKSYLLGLKNLSVKASEQGEGFNVKRTTSSLRMKALDGVGHLVGNIAPETGENIQRFAQNYGIKRERDLSTPVGTTKSVLKDDLLSIRQIKDARGNVIQEDYAFNQKYVQYLVNRDGTINTELVRRLQTTTKLSQEQINMAIAQEILKDRKIRLNNKFHKRKIVYENGNLHLVQENVDGTITQLTTQMVGNQMVVDLQTGTQSGRSFTHVFDNGIINRVVSKKTGQKAYAHYSFNSHTRQRTSAEHLINYANRYGKFAPAINEQEALLGLSEYDRHLFAEQEKNGVYEQVFEGTLNHAGSSNQSTPDFRENRQNENNDVQETDENLQRQTYQQAENRQREAQIKAEYDEHEALVAQEKADKANQALENALYALEHAQTDEERLSATQVYEQALRDADLANKEAEEKQAISQQSQNELQFAQQTLDALPLPDETPPNTTDN